MYTCLYSTCLYYIITCFIRTKDQSNRTATPRNCDSAQPLKFMRSWLDKLSISLVDLGGQMDRQAVWLWSFLIWTLLWPCRFQCDRPTQILQAKQGTHSLVANVFGCGTHSQATTLHQSKAQSTQKITKSDSWPPLAWPCPTRATHRQHLHGTSDNALPWDRSSILMHSALQCDMKRFPEPCCLMCITCLLPGYILELIPVANIGAVLHPWLETVAWVKDLKHCKCLKNNARAKVYVDWRFHARFQRPNALAGRSNPYLINECGTNNILWQKYKRTKKQMEKNKTVQTLFSSFPWFTWPLYVALSWRYNAWGFNMRTWGLHEHANTCSKANQSKGAPSCSVLVQESPPGFQKVPVFGEKQGPENEGVLIRIVSCSRAFSIWVYLGYGWICCQIRPALCGGFLGCCIFMLHSQMSQLA